VNAFICLCIVFRSFTLLVFYFFFAPLYFCLVEPMMPLSGPERKKYLADKKAKKAEEGYATSDPSGLLQRKIKRKDVTAKMNAGVGGLETDIDNAEAAWDGDLVEQSDLRKHKMMSTGNFDLIYITP